MSRFGNSTSVVQSVMSVSTVLDWFAVAFAVTVFVIGSGLAVSVYGNVCVSDAPAASVSA